MLVSRTHALAAFRSLPHAPSRGLVCDRPAVSSEGPRRVQPLSGYLLTGFVLLTMLVAARSLFQSETVLSRTLGALWFTVGVLVPWFTVGVRTDRD